MNLFLAAAEYFFALACDFKRNGSHDSAEFYTEVARRYLTLAEAS